MAKRGPKPKPTNLKILKGTQKTCRLNEYEPEPTFAMPEKPEYLDILAARQWDKLAHQLNEIGILSHIDGEALAMYCQLYSRWVACELQIQAKGITDITGRRASWAIEAHSCRGLMHRFMAEFGLTPSSRSNIIAKRQDPALDAFEDFMKKKG